MIRLLWKLRVLVLLSSIPGTAISGERVGAADSTAAAVQPVPERADLFAAPPTIFANPNRRAPLIAVIDIQSDLEVLPSLEIDDGERRWRQSCPVDPAISHRLAVLGMRPNREHIIRVRIENAKDGTFEISDPLTFRTPKLPENFPPIDTRLSEPQKMEPGITLFPVTIWLDDKSTMSYGYLVAVDTVGEVVWFLDTGHRIADVRVLSNGHILYLHAGFQHALEVDLLGNVIRQWHASRTTSAPNAKSVPVYVDTMHHEIAELPNGNFMSLATQLRQFDRFPTSVTDRDAPPAEAYVVCDEVVEFRPTDGWIVTRHPLTELLDRNRLGHLSLSDFWRTHYRDRVRGSTRDWSHANGLLYDADSDAFIVSVRHLDCLMKIERTTGNLIWLMGDSEEWGQQWRSKFLRPEGALEWPRHQHAPELTARGTILLYDNGNYQAPAFAPPKPAAENKSRVVEFQVSEESRTVSQVWEYCGTPDDTFYCPFYGDADFLPETGNVLVTDGGHIELADGTPHDIVPGERQWARIFEVTRTEPAEKVFEIVCDNGPESRVGWSIYRSIRIKSLSDLAVETELLARYKSGGKLEPVPEPAEPGPETDDGAAGR